jgi:hypothetical protein
MCRAADDAFGFVIARPSGLFPCRTFAFQLDRPSKLLCLDFRSCAKGSSPEFLRVPPSRSFRRATAYQGYRPSSRHRRCASTYRRGSQASATFRPQAFSASRRFAPRSVSAGLFHPAATSRVDDPSRGFSPHVSPPSFRRARPPCRWTLGHSPTEAGCHTQAPRLRGFLPREGALNMPWGLATTLSRSPPRVLVSSRSLHTP